MVSLSSAQAENTGSPLQLYYLFDPLCGWCYGASPVLEQLSAMDEFVITLCPTGLFADENARAMNKSFADYAWSNDQRIGHLTGQRFTDEYQQNVLADYTRSFDSGPATRALTAVATTSPKLELKALQAIQVARFVEGLDITCSDVLAPLLRTLGLGEAADCLLTQDQALLALNLERITQSQTMMASMAINGVPGLVVARGASRRLVTANVLLASFDSVVANLRAA